ncbi:MAG: sugar phosphate isomerase/epimerase [Acholeplasmatales bacterium]|nr:sugar phosphate isomerase/epimerase [Acholeplasmatales bacterium]
MHKYYVIPNLNKIDKYLDLSKKYDLGFEYNDFFEPSLLDDEEKLEKTLKSALKLGRVNDTLHGVFYDIVLDSSDSKIAKISYDRVKSSLDIASKLKCKGVVFHTNYLTWMKTDFYRNNWVNKNKEIYLKLIEEYKDLEIYIENMFDLDPYLLERLIKEINHPRIGVCLDIAHASISNVEIDEWFRVLGKFIKHIHINDNDRISDSHSELGKGIIDYRNAYKYINSLKQDISILIEIKDYDKTVNSINYLKEGKFDDIK